jgi:hypothetical protein
MATGFCIPNTFEEATSQWDDLGRKVAHVHLRRAQLVSAILNEPDPDKYGRDWTADDLGQEWGVTGERIRRYARTVKVFGSELEGLTALPKISWTHLEEIARLADPQERMSLLEVVQAERLSSNETRQRVSALLGEGVETGATVSLPGLSGSTKKASVQLPTDVSFLAAMERLAAWANSSAKAIRALNSRIGPDGIFAADGNDQGEASEARNQLDELRDAIQELRPSLVASIPAPVPMVSIMPTPAVPEGITEDAPRRTVEI